ncbi:MAG: phytanoyl-CoA dioxygenase family protein [Opitutaceae bacterium]
MPESTIRTYELADRAGWLAAYARDGFVRVKGVFSATELDEIEAFFDDYLEDPSGALENNTIPLKVAHRGATLEQVDRTKGQVRCLHPHRTHPDPVNRWYLHENIAAVLDGLFGKPALAAQTMYYYKPPGAKGQGMHQDNFYLLTAPAVCIGAWTAIDDADEENGCLWMAPGSHREGIFCPDKDLTEPWLNYGDTHIAPYPRQHRPVPVPVKRGETLFFHGLIIHGSGPNRTANKWRRTFIGHYCDEATETISEFYHPVLNMQGETVSDIGVHAGGGPCGGEWRGKAH